MGSALAQVFLTLCVPLPFPDVFCECFLLGELFVNSLWALSGKLGIKGMNVCVNNLCSVENPCAGLDMDKEKKVQGKNLWSAC